jgi:hypothetical protein
LVQLLDVHAVRRHRWWWQGGPGWGHRLERRGGGALGKSALGLADEENPTCSFTAPKNVCLWRDSIVRVCAPPKHAMCRLSLTFPNAPW